jgi:hypothetical protein
MAQFTKRTTMPVVLVNPAGGRGAVRRNPRKKRAKRRAAARKRRRNPAGGGGGKMTFIKAAMATGIGLPMGVVAHGISWGVDKAEIGAGARAAIKGGVGLVGSMGLAYLDARAAAGLAGGTGAVLTRDLIELYQMSQVGKNGATTTTATTATTEAAAVFTLPAARARAEAAAVFRRAEAGAVVRAFPMPSMATRSMKPDAGASRFVPGPVRWFGPESWAYRADAAGRRIVSAHNR